MDIKGGALDMKMTFQPKKKSEKSYRAGSEQR